MAEAVLVEEIRRQLAADIDAAWKAARADADACHEGCAQAIAHARQKAATQVDRAARAAGAAATARAEATARRIRACAGATLAARLYGMAIEALARFRNDDYPALFSALARELPSRDWQRVIVHPADAMLAREHFPQAQIRCDGAIEAGLIVEADDGRVRVSNTLRARLDAAWPDLLPRIMRDVRDQCVNV